MIPAEMIPVGLLSFAGHFAFKWWKAEEQSFRRWIGSKEVYGYWVSSGILSLITLTMYDYIGPLVHINDPRTYSIVMCYGGAHAVQQYIALKKATGERRATKKRNEVRDEPPVERA